MDNTSTPFGTTPNNPTAPIMTAMNGISMANPMQFGMGFAHPTAMALHHPANNPFVNGMGMNPMLNPATGNMPNLQ